MIGAMLYEMIPKSALRNQDIGFIGPADNSLIKKRGSWIAPMSKALPKISVSQNTILAGIVVIL
jgi:hypothetical protein